MPKRNDDDRQGGFDFGSGSDGGLPPSPPPPAPRTKGGRTLHDVYFGLVPGRALIDEQIAPIGNAYLAAGGHAESLRSGMLHTSLLSVGSYQTPVPEGDVALACQAATMVRFRPFRVVLNRIQWWRGSKAVVLLSGDGVEAIGELCRALALAFDAVGLVAGGWTKNPHITLAYSSREGSDRAIGPIAWDVRDFVLIKNTHGTGRHEHLGRWPLTGP